jgi:hypothetical protein
MKLKTLVAVAISSMLAASFAYAAPSAVDMGDDGSAMQPSAASSTSAAASASMDNTNIGAIPGGANASPNSATPGDMASNTSPSAEGMQMNPGSSDDMNADTATGDDDY